MIQVFSDLHLERIKAGVDYTALPPKCPYLFLAGDITTIDNVHFIPFFDYVSKNWERVFYVLGNHEYYNQNSVNIYSIGAKYREALSARYTNVHLVDRDVIEIGGTRIIGCTLWGHYSLERPVSYHGVFKYIKSDIRPIQTLEFNTFNREAIEWIKANYDPNFDTIVLTHYPMTYIGSSDERFDWQEDYIRNFVSNDIKLPKGDKKLVCISGHTHHSRYDKIDGVLYIANQKGYVDEMFDTLFNADATYAI
jgi:predicted phosphodiesterase